MPQQGRRVVQDHEVDPRARHLAPEAPDEETDRAAALLLGGLRIDQHRDVEVALGPSLPAGTAAEEERKPHRWKPCQGQAQPLRRRFRALRRHGRSTPWPSAAVAAAVRED